MQKKAPTKAAPATKFLEMDRKLKSFLISLDEPGSDEYARCVREKTTSMDRWKALDETFASRYPEADCTTSTEGRLSDSKAFVGVLGSYSAAPCGRFQA